MASSHCGMPVAAAPSTIAELSDDQQQRLTQLLDHYLRGLEQGDPVDVQQMLNENADLALVLRAYLSKLDGLHGIAAGFQNHGELEPLVSGEPDSDEAKSRIKSLKLGEYTIVRELGRGGMGIVYEARQRTLNRRVALKLLPMASMLDARQISRFKNESHAAAQLQHPNIVPVYSFGVERGIHFYAMQYIEGQTIDSWIASSVDAQSPHQWRQTARIMMDAADALHCAHECGIVHRDIKPSNLMLDQSENIWVTDFGLARCQNDLSLTLSGDLVGTMRYMSPEQAGGRAELVDHRTDIYSLGATMYEMLTGDAAIKGEDGPSVLSEIANGNPPRVRRIMRHVPADLEVVLLKAMAKEKDDRYATAREFAEDLKAVLENRPTLAKPPSLPTIAGRWAIRHRKLVAAASMVLLFGMLGLAASSVIIAEKNRDIERYFRQAQDTVDRLGTRVATQLALVPGAEHVRQSLLRDNLAYYEQFVAQATGDHELQAELAMTHSRIGALVKELESAERSIPHYERSAEIYRELAENTPDSPMLLREMAQNLNQLGLAAHAAGQTAKAFSAYENSIQLQRRLVAQDLDWNDRTELALTKSNHGLLLSESGHAQRARAELTEAIELLTAATTADGSNVLAARGLAAALGNLSSLSLDANPRDSIPLLEQAIDHQLRISKHASNPLKPSREIATTYNTLGAAYLGTGQLDQATDAFSNAVRIQRRLQSIAPLVDEYRVELAISLNNLATALLKKGDQSGASKAAEEAISLQLACLRDKTPDGPSSSRLGVMFNNQGTALEAIGDIQNAVSSFQSAVEHQQTAITLDPQSPQFNEYLLQHYSNLLRLQVRDQRWRDAELTSGQYRDAATQQPTRLLAVAEDLAGMSQLAPAGLRRDRVVSEIAATLLAAREAGMHVDSSLLRREPFRPLANEQSLRKVMQP